MHVLLRVRMRPDDRRYARGGWKLALRTILLVAWPLIVTYIGAVFGNLLGLLRQGVSHLVDPAALVIALFLPDFFASWALIPFVLGFALLVAGGVWAARDYAIERVVLRKRKEKREAQRKADYARREHDEQIGASQLAVASLYIIPIDGGETKREPLLHDEVTIGRDTDNLIVLADTHASRRQMVLRRELHDWHMTCLPDAARLLLNGSERTSATLRPHDQMVVGGTILRFDAPPSPTTTAMADQAPRLVVTCQTVEFTALLRDGEITLGRAPDCGIVIPSEIMSRHHAQLIRTAAAYEIRDTGSKNGLWFEGKRVPQHTFHDRDLVTIGSSSGEEVRLRYLAPDGSATTEVDLDLDRGGPFGQIHLDGDIA